MLIIDDIGNSLKEGMAVARLPGKVNLSVLPHTAHARELAQAGFAAGKEIMLHAPMSNEEHKAPGRGALLPQQPREVFDRTLLDDLAAVPHVRGVNNHMGSELTTMPLQMGWVMQALLRRELYFVDSRTSRETVAAKTASAYGVPNLSRSVFLDNTAEPVAIRRQLETLLRYAERDRVAVGIGHPYPATVAVLQQEIPRLACRGFELMLVSEAIARWGTVPHGAIAKSPAQNMGSGETLSDVRSDPHLDAAGGHVGLGLGDGVLAEVEDGGGEHGIGSPLENALDQMIQVAHAP